VYDNFDAYQVILANGEIVEATAASHRDLRFALTGGSNNFGIVTRFYAPTWQLNEMWGGGMILNYSQAVLDTHAQAFSNFMSSENFSNKAHGGTLLFFEEGQYNVADALYYTEPIDNPPIYSNFMSIRPQIANTLDVSTAAKLVAGSDGRLPANVTWFVHARDNSRSRRTDPAWKCIHLEILL
jgi:hypothetical protein